jgi:hypothetical protein
VAHLTGQHRRGRRHVHRSDHGGIDHRVPFAAGQHRQVRGHGAVAVQRLGTGTGLTVASPGEGRHVMSAGYRLVNDRASNEPGSA